MARTYWQIAAGSVGREYSDYFLRHGIAFVGGDKNRATLSQVKVGDVLILKSGLSKVLAAGEVVERNGKHQGDGDLPWLKDFDGWDLRGYCFVDWRIPKEPEEVAGFTRTTIQKTHTNEHHQLADRILEYPIAPISSEPGEVKELKDDEILVHLIKLGLRPANAEDLLTTFNRIRLLSKYYYDNCPWNEVREHEIRAFLVLPLLLALGWAEQQLKLELPCSDGRIDIACFRGPWRGENSDCQMLVETKDFSSGLSYAHKQVKAYASDFPNCQTLIVSNGFCYKVYEKVNEEFGEDPVAYLNLNKPKKQYPLNPKVGGGLGVFTSLLPSVLNCPRCIEKIDT